MAFGHACAAHSFYLARRTCSSFKQNEATVDVDSWLC